MWRSDKVLTSMLSRPIESPRDGSASAFTRVFRQLRVDARLTGMNESFEFHHIHHIHHIR